MMSSHPQIERLIESVKSSINKYLGVFDTNDQGSFRKGFSKAAIWTIGALVAISIPIAIIQQLQPGNHWLENASRIALAILVSAFGQNLNLLGLAGSSSSVISVGAHPTLLTLVIAWLAFRAGKHFSKEPNKAGDNGRSHRFAMGLGSGSAVALLAATWILQGSFGWGTAFASLSISSLFDFILSLAMVAFPAWMGTKFGEVVSLKSSGLAWARRATLNFVILYSAILAVGFLVWIIFTLIAPHFAPSQPDSKADFNFNLGQVALVVVVVLAYLPNFLFMVFGAGAGMSVGLDAQGVQGLDALLASVQNVVPGGVPTAFSINSSYGMILQAIVLAVVAVVALIAGASATKKTSFYPTSGIHYIQSLFIVVVIGIFASYLGNIGGSWSAPAVGTTPASTGTLSFGVVLASLALVATVVVTFAWFAAAKTGDGVANAFPKLVARLGSTQPIARTHKGWTMFGRLATSLLALGLIVYPITSASVSRVWATTDTPTLIGESAAAKVLEGQLDEIKALIGPKVKDEQWLPDEALSAALPKTDNEMKIAVKNNQNKDWVVGNTDATVKVSWTKGKVVANWDVPTSSKISNHYLLVDHADFTSNIEPIFLDIQVNKFMSAANAGQLKVNGVVVPSGVYAVVPGFYRITLPGQDLISETDVTLGTDGSTTSHIAGNVALIPEGGEAKLNSALDSQEEKCKKVSDKGAASCFSAKDATGAVIAKDKEAPAKYFQKENSGWKVESIECGNETADELVTSKSLKRTKNCKVNVSFTTTYYKGQTVFKTVPVYDEWCDYDYDTYEEYCETYVSYYDYRTVNLRGAKISSVRYTSEFNVTLAASGTLKKGKFVVK